VPDITTRFAMGIFLIALAALAIWFGGWPFRALVLVGAGVIARRMGRDAPRCVAVDLAARSRLLAACCLGGMEYFYQVGEADTVALGLASRCFRSGPRRIEPLLYLGARRSARACCSPCWRGGRPRAGDLSMWRCRRWRCLALSWVDYALVFWVMIVHLGDRHRRLFRGKADRRGPRLAPRISPAKTWSGLLGGAVAAGLLGYLAARYFEIDAAPDAETGEASWLYQSFLYLGAPLAIVAQAGDLYESWVKRRCGVKDSGTILPGHGGVLDRCDGLIAVSFTTLLILIAGLWLG
jgi:phosphatidate cytidylyltransferase